MVSGQVFCGRHHVRVTCRMLVERDGLLHGPALGMRAFDQGHGW